MIEVPRIVAHRGSSGRAPENTLHAMQLAIEEDGATGLELDLQRTADGTVIVLHDETVDRTTDGQGRADSLALDALRELDAAARFGDGEFAGRGIDVPTFEEVLESFPSHVAQSRPQAGRPGHRERDGRSAPDASAAPRASSSARRTLRRRSAWPGSPPRSPASSTVREPVPSIAATACAFSPAGERRAIRSRSRPGTDARTCPRAALSPMPTHRACGSSTGR